MMPSWREIQPRAVAPQLPIIWSYKYDRISKSFMGRLAGDRITRLYGKSFRSLPLIETHSPEVFKLMHALFSRIVLDRVAYRGGGRLFKQLDRYGLGERIILPLSSDGFHADGILGATEYAVPYIVPGAPIRTVTEEENWFAL